ncbi:hypothetical protein [Xanthomonas euvesicatoria]|uniref:hypothetical protein n=1 Tax=Xanthomonas euvesicatoria TaxID=456327 RepID=UPI001C45157F|nr:hypothetical protein [Xanthomonas euvesicatoria]MBV6805555.1 hypothetical protein [Xanthomonas campestris pv. convolvuli]
MTTGPVPASYDAWRRCIELDCDQPRTAAFIAQRLAALRDPDDHHTKQFLRRWGAQHHVKVIAWFEQARQQALQG